MHRLSSARERQPFLAQYRTPNPAKKTFAPAEQPDLRKHSSSRHFALNRALHGQHTGRLLFEVLVFTAATQSLLSACNGSSGPTSPVLGQGGIANGSGGTATTGSFTAGAQPRSASGGTQSNTRISGTAEGGSQTTGGGPTLVSFTATGGAGTTQTGSLSTPQSTSPSPSATALGETRLTSGGLTESAYGGYLNGEAFQQDGIFSHKGFQYTAYWNTARHVVLARRRLLSGEWSTIEFLDYTNTANDDHNTISLGLSPCDGTLHLAFDHHTTKLHYRRSKLDILNNPESAQWETSAFTPTTDTLVSNTPIADVTYPRFVTRPDGSALLLSLRIGTSGLGDEHLYEYVQGAWVYVGLYISGAGDGTVARPDVNAYLHGLAYDLNRGRLHAAWCWRNTSEPWTNHDLAYGYSDDNGRTWKNNSDELIGTAGSAKVISQVSSNINVVQIGTSRGLINQEHMMVDGAGRVHVLLGHIVDTDKTDYAKDFVKARDNSKYFHYFRNEQGVWVRNPIQTEPVFDNFRGKLAASKSGNLYAILPGRSSTEPGLRILGASPKSSFATWLPLVADARQFHSDPLVDLRRLLTEDVITVFFPMKGAPDDSDKDAVSSDIYTLDFATP